jgi:hypothetical protein
MSSPRLYSCIQEFYPYEMENTNYFGSEVKHKLIPFLFREVVGLIYELIEPLLLLGRGYF